MNPLFMEKEEIQKETTESGIPQTPFIDESKKVISFEEYKELEKGFLEEKKKMEDRMWVDSNLRKIEELLRLNYDNSIKTFSENIIHHIAKVVNAVYGAFFIVNNEKQLIKATGGYACTIETMAKTEFHFGEGIIGQVAKTQEPFFMDNVETQISSSLGSINTSFFLVHPLVFNNTVYGIIELNTLSKPKPRILELVGKMGQSVASSLQYIMNNEKSRLGQLDILELMEEIKSLQKEIENKNDEINRLSAQNGLQISDLSPIPVVDIGIQAAQDRISELEELLNKTEVELNKSREFTSFRIQELETQILEKEKELTDLLDESQQKLQDALLEAQEKEEELKAVLEKIHQLEENSTDAPLPTSEGPSSADAELRYKEYEKQLNARDNYIADIEKQMETMNLEIRSNTQAIELAQSTIKQKEQEIISLEEAYNEKKTEIAHLKNTYIQATTENSKIFDELQRLRDLLKEKENELNTLASELESFKENLPQFDQGEFTQLQIRLEQKENEIQSLKNEASLRDENDQKNEQELNGVKAILRKKEDEILVLQYMLRLKQEEQPEQLEADKLRQQLYEKERLTAKMEAEFNEKLSHLIERSEFDKLKIELDEKQADLDNLKQSLSEKNDPILLNDLESLKIQLAEKDKELSKLMEETNYWTTHSVSLDAFKNLETEFTKKEEELSQLKEMLSQQENSTVAQEGEYYISKEEELKEFARQLQEKEQTLLNREKEAENLQTELQQKDAQIEELEKEIAGLKTLNEVGINENVLTNEIGELKAFLQQLKESEATIQQELDEYKQSKEEEVERLKQELAKSFDAYQLLLTKQPAENQVGGEEESLASGFSKEIEQLKEKLSEKENEVAYYKRELEKLPPVGNTETLQVGELHQEIEGLKEFLQNKEGEIQQMKLQLEFQQKELAEKEQHMHQKQMAMLEIFNKVNSAFASMEIDMDGTILDLNNNFLMLTGMKLEDIKGQNYSNILAKEYTETSEYKVFWEGLRMGVAQHIENLTVLGNRGKEIEMTDVSFIPLFGDDEKPYEIIKLVNFPSKIKAESEERGEEISTKEDNSSMLVDSEQASPLSQGNVSDTRKASFLDQNFMIMELDLNGRIISVNKLFLLNVDFEEKELIGLNHKEIVHITDRSSPDYVAALSGFEHGINTAVSIKYIDKEGGFLRTRTFFNIISDENDKPHKVMVVAHKI